MPRRVHAHAHAFGAFRALEPEGLTLFSRRNMLKASLAGIAGLSFPGLLRTRAEAGQANRRVGSGKSVILLWMTGGPSHLGHEAGSAAGESRPVSADRHAAAG